MKKIAILLSLCSFSVGAVAGSPTCNDVKGTWKNELNSTLTISNIDQDGKLSGTYSSPSGTSGETFPLIGWTNVLPAKPDIDNARIVSFSVGWGKYGSVTSWSGVCIIKNGTPTITTVWNLARSNSQFGWDHIITNSDIFTPK